jgi:hypothetical protein
MKYLNIILFFISFSAEAQADFELPKEAKPFVVKGYEAYDYVVGDINADGKKDAILVLKYVLQPSDTLDYEERYYTFPVLLLLRNHQGKLELKFKADSVLTYMSSPKYYGYIETDTIQKNNFTISTSGGRRYKWRMEYVFKYNVEKKEFYLFKETQSNFSPPDSESEKDEIIVFKADELPYIKFQDYNEDKDFYESYREALVKVPKTYFYSNPDLKSNPRKAFVMKGDKLSINMQTKNFVQVYFTNKQDKSTSGFILRKDLQLIK